MDLTKWIEAKKKKKMTIADIADKAGLPKGTVQNIFAGYVPSPRLDTVQAIEHALGLDEETQGSTVTIPEKYGEVFVALNEGDKDLTQDDVDDIIRFIEFRKSTKKN